MFTKFFFRNFRFALPIVAELALCCSAAADVPAPDQKPLPVVSFSERIQ